MGAALHNFNNANGIRIKDPKVRHLKPVLREAQEGVLDVFGYALLNTTKIKAADLLVERAAANMKTRVAFLNAHCINTAYVDPVYARCLRHMDLLLPDGAGIKMAAQLSNQYLMDNLNGTDLFPLICERAAKAHQAIYLLGARPGVAERVATAMKARFPSLRIAGTHDGYFTEYENKAVIADINRSGAALVFVAMGVPAQEKWIERNADAINAPVILGVGGLFDFYSGRIPRAPELLRENGLEWTWRLAQEPRRMFKRYVLGNPLFIARTLLSSSKQGIVQDALKRTIDICGAGLGLLLLSPLFAALALAVRVESKGPAFFKQERVGLNGKTFTMWKFRSMVQNAEDIRKTIEHQSERDGVCFKMKQDPRITKTGRFLRRFSLDELPQLWNVFQGDMSLVGPRPALPQEVAQYSMEDRKRLKGKPGLTCIWQVSGRADIPFEQQVKMDCDYLNRRSLLLDIQLLFQTLSAVTSGRGAY